MKPSYPRTSFPAVASGPVRRSPAILGLFVLAGAVSCGGGGGGGSGGTSAPVGTILQNPATGDFFVVDAHQGGDAPAFKLVETYWGRLVDVYDVDSTAPVFRDFVISDDITNNGLDYLLTRDPLTEREKLTILHQHDSPEFAAALIQAEINLQVMLKKSLSPTELPPFTAVPRNAAIVLKFNDLVEDGGSPVPGSSYPGTVNAATVEILTGYAPVQPYETRILPDPNHGDLVGGQFHTTRVIIDLTVSEDDAINTNLPVNSLGLPEAVNANQPNGVVRIPSQTNPPAQQFQILTNLAGRGIAFNGNGPTDPQSPTLDVVRAFRSGGKTSITGDAHNGFLRDEIPPVIIGTQVVSVIFVGPLGGSNGMEFDITVQYQSPICARPPIVGDVLEFPNHRMQVIQDFQGQPIGGLVGPFRVRLLCINCVPSTPPIGTGGQYQTIFRGVAPNDPPEFAACFVRFSPTPSALPNAGVPSDATLTITFSEPIDPSSVQAFDTFTVAYDNNALSTNLLYRNVVGRMVPSQDLRRYTFQPVLPLRKVVPGGSPDRYLFEVKSDNGVTDLAGNELEFGIPESPFLLTTAGAAVDSGGVSLRFNSGDEDADGAPEIRGQFLFDIAHELIRPRPVARFSQVCDSSVPIVGAMVPFTAGLQTPLSNWGSKLMAVWRYCDLGMSLRDDSTHNIDVEGLWWQPFSGSVQVDNFTQFQMSFAHSKYLPDEQLSTALLPNWPNSGLVAKFEDNLLDKTSDPLTVVHPKAKGYTLAPNDTKIATSGAVIAPWPLNRGVPQTEFVYWTWRDTGKIAVAAPSGDGADPQRLTQISGKGAGINKFYPVNKVPTIGLPLLMEFRTYEDAKANGQNGFKVAIALNSSSQPFFRAFSTGGINPNNPGQITKVDPDTETTAKGGVSQNGLPSPGRDNVVYFGQGDFLVRVSRVHTIWFDTLPPGSANTIYSDPVIEPGASLAPAGTQLLLAFRGATQITLNSPPPGVLPYRDANLMDAYGDGFTSAQLTLLSLSSSLSFTPQFYPVSTDKSWKSNVSAINNANFFQARVTFITNPITGLVPELTSLGFAFRR
jgi:hypothetical protein